MRRVDLRLHEGRLAQVQVGAGGELVELLGGPGVAGVDEHLVVGLDPHRVRLDRVVHAGDGDAERAELDDVAVLPVVAVEVARGCRGPARARRRPPGSALLPRVRTAGGGRGHRRGGTGSRRSSRRGRSSGRRAGARWRRHRGREGRCAAAARPAPRCRGRAPGGRCAPRTAPGRGSSSTASPVRGTTPHSRSPSASYRSCCHHPGELLNGLDLGPEEPAAEDAEVVGTTGGQEVVLGLRQRRGRARGPHAPAARRRPWRSRRRSTPA